MDLYSLEQIRIVVFANMYKKVVKIITFTLMLSILSTSAVFAEDSSVQEKNTYLNNISKNSSNKSLQDEKKSIIDSRKYDKKIIMSELDLCKKIDSEKNISYKNENSMVKKYLNSIVELGTKDSKELKDLGYNSQRIEQLKTATSLIKSNPTQLEQITESHLLENVSSQVTLSTSLDGYLHDVPFNQTSGNFKTIINILFHWQWSEVPIVQNTDGFGVGFNSTNNLQIYNVNTTVSYFNNFDNSYYDYTDFSQQATNNISADKNAFFITYPVTTGKNLKKKTALTMDAFVTLVNRNSYVDQFDITTLFGHSTDTMIPQFSLTKTGISISSQYAAVSNLYSKSLHYNINDYTPIS